MNFQPYFRTPLKVFARGRSGSFTPSPQAKTTGEGRSVLEPTNCVGVWYRKMGTDECWEATGAVREIFKELSKEIKNHLKDWGEPGDPIVTWSIYMIGKTKTTAIPTLLFCCSKHGPRKSIKTQIVESGILRRYPNVRVGECSKPPDFGMFIPLSDPRNNKDDQLMLLVGTEYCQASYIHGNGDVDKTVFIHPTHRILGSRIFGANMQTATAGISFQLYGRYYIITVGHIFTQEDQSSDLDQDSDSEFDFEIPGVEGGSSDLTSGDSELDHCPPSPNLPAQEQAISKDGLIKLGTVVFSSTDAGNPGLDFSVVEIDQGYIESNNTAIFAATPNYNFIKRGVNLEPTNQNVKAVTTSNHALEGRLSGTPAFIRCSSGVGFQEVWAVKFNGQISQGDCGSLVVGIDDNVIHGHIIAGNPVSGMAYIVPAFHIFNCLDSCIVPQDAVNHPATLLYEGEMPGIDRYPHFPTRRNINDDEMLVDIEKVGASGDYLCAFTESSCAAFRYEAEVLEDFCRGVSFANVVAGQGAAGYDKVVWIDDRKGNSGLDEGSVTKQCQNLLTATGLFQALKKSRFDHTNFSYRRRLIYIEDLSPGCIHILIATASRYHVPALRTAIYKHLAFRVSIAVKISDHTPFQLDLHLPFFILGNSKPLKPHGGFNTKPQRSWTDLSFLQLSDHESDRVWGMQEAQISLVITGDDGSQWVGYSFVDSEIDGILAELSPKELCFDQIAAGQLGTDLPIWAPRDYWLRVLEIRIEQTRSHWEHLICKVERSVNQYLIYHSCTLSRARRKTSDTEEFFDWILKMMDLLQRLDDVLTGTVAEWKTFNSSGQNISYFLNTDGAATSSHNRRSLHAIDNTFQQLQNNQMRIGSLKIKCSHFLKILELRLAQEGKEIAKNNGVTSVFTVLVLYPIALATAIFGLDPAVIPFDQTRKSFALCIVTLIAITFVTRLVIRYIPRLSRLLSTRGITITLTERVIPDGHYRPLVTESHDKIMSYEKTNLRGITTI